MFGIIRLPCILSTFHSPRSKEGEHYVENLTRRDYEEFFAYCNEWRKYAEEDLGLDILPLPISDLITHPIELINTDKDYFTFYYISRLQEIANSQIDMQMWDCDFEWDTYMSQYGTNSLGEPFYS
nr:TPA_asm: hypothetical protein [Ichthyophonus archaeparvovirus]